MTWKRRQEAEGLKGNARTPNRPFGRPHLANHFGPFPLAQRLVQGNHAGAACVKVEKRASTCKSLLAGPPNPWAAGTYNLLGDPEDHLWLLQLQLLQLHCSVVPMQIRTVILAYRPRNSPQPKPPVIICHVCGCQTEDQWPSYFKHFIHFHPDLIHTERSVSRVEVAENLYKERATGEPFGLSNRHKILKITHGQGSKAHVHQSDII